MVKKSKKHKRRYNPYRKATRVGAGLVATGIGMYALGKGINAIK